MSEPALPCEPPTGPDTLRLAPVLAQIATALDWVEEQAAAHELPPKAAFGLALSVDEALTNVVNYAFPAGAAAAAAQIVLHCEAGDGLRITIWDNGSPFDPTAQQSDELSNSIDEADIGGHGLRLMHHYLKDMRYARRGDWNVLQLAALSPSDPTPSSRTQAES